MDTAKDEMIHGVAAHQQILNSGAVQARRKLAELGRPESANTHKIKDSQTSALSPSWWARELDS